MRDIASIIMSSKKDKYDWLAIMSIVYNDVYGFERHSFKGSVFKLHYHGKCAIVYFNDKSNSNGYSSSLNSFAISDSNRKEAHCDWNLCGRECSHNTEESYDLISGKCNDYGIDCFAIASWDKSVRVIIHYHTSLQPFVFAKGECKAILILARY